MSDPRDMTTEEAAAYLNVSERTLYRLAKRLRLRRVEYGHRLKLWPRSELDRARDRHTRTVR